MNKTKRTLNELLVHIFNYILAIEEKNLKDRGLPLSMNDVHILECIQRQQYVLYRQSVNDYARDAYD